MDAVVVACIAGLLLGNVIGCVIGWYVVDAINAVQEYLEKRRREDT